MTDQEFRELRSMIERRVREAHALGRVAQKKRIPYFPKKRFDGGTDRRAQSWETNGSRYPQVLRKT